jgi:hypothetical protein
MEYPMVSKHIYDDSVAPASDDEPTLPSVPVLEVKAPPLVAWWRAVLGLVLLGGGP